MKVNGQSIILFDGVCNFCNQSVRFIINRDPKGYYQFSSLQGEWGQKLLKQYGVDKNANSVILIENQVCYQKSSAALRILRNLRGVWKIGFLLIIIPAPIRDFIYDLIAMNRYKWFGKKEGCLVAAPEMKGRFLPKENRPTL